MSGIAVLDSGGQYCHLIARKIRQLSVPTEVLAIDAAPEQLAKFDGIVVSGGPRSVLEPRAPRLNPATLNLGVPVLGICYGHQLLAHTLSPTAVACREGSREYGAATLKLQVTDTLFKNVPKSSEVWMSHGDSVQRVPEGFTVLASTDKCEIAAMGDLSRKFFGVQFHPEVAHTQHGDLILENFVFQICRSSRSWDPANPLAIDNLLQSIRKQVRDDQRVLFFVSGGVDSAVAYKLCVNALGADRVRGVFVDTGLLRRDEGQEVSGLFQQYGITNVETVRAENRFLAALQNVTDPEAKRRQIGLTFLDVENEVLARFKQGEWLLGQGTIYPDTIESGGSREAALIKTHHNRVPELLERISSGQVVEPLVQFYKDEVRKIGRALGLPAALVEKQPFPGPGLAVRTLCASGPSRLERNAKLSEIASRFKLNAWALPVQAVGVQGDERTYASVAVVESVDGTYDWDQVRVASAAITNSVPNVNRVACLIRAKTSVEEWRGHQAHLTKERLDLLRDADRVARLHIDRDPAAKKIWQCPVVLIPVGSNGREAVAVRPVNSIDGMTAEWVRLTDQTLSALADALFADPSIEALLLDVTNKPPATIEWE